MTDDDGSGWVKVFDADTPLADLPRIARAYTARALDDLGEQLDEDYPAMTATERAHVLAEVERAIYPQALAAFTSGHRRLQQ